MLKIGSKYKNRLGAIITIVGTDDNDSNIFIDHIGSSYYRNGEYYYNNHTLDLIEEI